MRASRGVNQARTARNGDTRGKSTISEFITVDRHQYQSVSVNKRNKPKMIKPVRTIEQATREIEAELGENNQPKLALRRENLIARQLYR